MILSVSTYSVLLEKEMLKVMFPIQASYMPHGRGKETVWQALPGHRVPQ